MTAEAFLRGLLAALVVQNHPVLKARQATFHRAFHRVVEEATSGRIELPQTVDFREVDFDPLYGLSGWLDLALTRAQRDSIVNFPNPSYGRLEIRYNKAEGQRQLAASGMKKPLVKLSGVFFKALGNAARTAS